MAKWFDRMLERVAARDEEQRRLRENPERRAEMRRAEREEARKEAEVRRAERERQERENLPVFDADAWKPTEKALEMLARLEGSDVHGNDQDDLASANERKYADVAAPYADRAIEKYNAHTGTSHGRYDTIALSQGLNGDCHSRKTTYRRFKFGKGSLSERGYLRSGFSENKGADNAD